MGSGFYSFKVRIAQYLVFLYGISSHQSQTAHLYIKNAAASTAYHAIFQCT